MNDATTNTPTRSQTMTKTTDINEIETIIINATKAVNAPGYHAGIKVVRQEILNRLYAGYRVVAMSRKDGSWKIRLTASTNYTVR